MPCIIEYAARRFCYICDLQRVILLPRDKNKQQQSIQHLLRVQDALAESATAAATEHESAIAAALNTTLLLLLLLLLLLPYLCLLGGWHRVHLCCVHEVQPVVKRIAAGEQAAT
jgi:hypothetical protein